MNYRLILDEPGARPGADFSPDSLFNADSHSKCVPEHSDLWFLCSRRLYVIEPIPELVEIYEHDFYHVCARLLLSRGRANARLGLAQQFTEGALLSR